MEAHKRQASGEEVTPENLKRLFCNQAFQGLVALVSFSETGTVRKATHVLEMLLRQYRASKSGGGCAGG